MAVRRDGPGAKIESHVGEVQRITGEEFFDQIALIAKADDEVRDPMGGVNLHDMPKKWPTADFDEGLGPESGLFAESRTQSASQYHCLHQFIRFVDMRLDIMGRVH